MKTACTLSLAAVVVGGASCQRLLQDIPEVGLGPLVVAAADTSGRFPDYSGSSGSTIEDDLVVALEADDQVTVVGSVELGELLCKSLDKAEDAEALSFLVLNGERVLAEKTTYTFTAGDIFTDQVGRHVWTGVVIDPVQAEDEALPRTVSMSWGEVCSVETFLLKVTKRNTDGTTSLIKTVPCDTIDMYTCLVEVLLEFDESGEEIVPEEDIFPGRTTSRDGPTSGGGTASASSSERRQLEGSPDTVIDVLILYSAEAKVLLGGISDAQMESTIKESLDWTNTAFVNSDVAISINLAHIDKLPYGETTDDSKVALETLMMHPDVKALRNLYQADLVQMISGDILHCGRGYLVSSDMFGYSVAKASCLDNHSHTHEFGHNLGCYHNREDATLDTDYAHAVQYCDEPRYRTIMAYKCPSSPTPRVNHFSNPDVSVLERVTGTETENNARAIEDNMVAVSNFRSASPPTPTVVPDTPSPSPSPTTTPVVPDTPSPSPSPTTTPENIPTPAPSALDTPFPSAVAVPTPAPSNDRLETPVPSDVPTIHQPPTTAPTTSTTPTNTTTASYLEFGCYGDDANDRVLSGEFVKNDSGMTTETCALFCEGSAYFGTEYGKECFCGPSSDTPKRLGSTTCDFSCAGDTRQTCGGRNAISVYQYETDFSFLGCFRDSRSSRALSGASKKNEPTMTTQVCANFCAGSTYFGTEYSKECFCGVESDDPRELGEATCDYECDGNPSETCGGRNAISVYQYSDGPKYLGCWGDSKSGRIMDRAESVSSMTNDLCAVLCESHPFYGTQYGVECWCGEEGIDLTVHGPSDDCDYACNGDARQTCGGFNAMSVWEF